MSHPNTLGTAVITGASSGIGKVYADRLAARGYNLLLVARRGDRLQAIADDLQTRHAVTVRTLVADLTDAEGLAKTEQAITNDPAVSMLVNNAGTSKVGLFKDVSPEAITSLVALNVTALTRLTRAILPTFQQRNSGTVINIGSVLGYASHPLSPLYCGTKAYVQNFTLALQQQLKDTAIRVQLVTPATTVSEIWEIAGISLDKLNPATVMTTDHCVDAALRGLDMGEVITLPSLHDENVIHAYTKAGTDLLTAVQTGQPAPRYGLS